jgi:purine catabolism regulator
MPGAQPSVGVGATVEWESMSKALREASMAAHAGGTIESRSWHDASQPDLDRLLWLLRDDEPLRSFVTHQLEPILAHDRESKHKLMPTLEALCRHGGNKSLAAGELFLARQALYNRLERISELLGRDISQPDALASANIAVKAARYMHLV